MARQFEIPKEFELRMLFDLANLGSNLFANAEWLEGQGFRCHIVSYSALRSMCPRERLNDYDTYLIEEAKEIIGYPGLDIPTLIGKGDGYKSPWLERKREERDQALGSRSRSDFPWSFEIDPARQAADALKATEEGWRNLHRLNAEHLEAVDHCKREEAEKAARPIHAETVIAMMEQIFTAELSAHNFQCERQDEILLLRGPCVGPLQLCASVSVHEHHVNTGQVCMACHFRHAENNMTANAQDSLCNLPRKYQIPVKFQHACLGFLAYSDRNRGSAVLAASVSAHGRLLSHLVDDVIAIATRVIAADKNGTV